MYSVHLELPTRPASTTWDLDPYVGLISGAAVSGAAALDSAATYRIEARRQPGPGYLTSSTPPHPDAVTTSVEVGVQTGSIQLHY
jgi:hypothetical protein